MGDDRWQPADGPDALYEILECDRIAQKRRLTPEEEMRGCNARLYVLEGLDQREEFLSRLSEHQGMMTRREVVTALVGSRKAFRESTGELMPRQCLWHQALYWMLRLHELPIPDDLRLPGVDHMGFVHELALAEKADREAEE